MGTFLLSTCPEKMVDQHKRRTVHLSYKKKLDWSLIPLLNAKMQKTNAKPHHNKKKGKRKKGKGKLEANSR